MDFGELLTAAWRIAWRHKYLWVLGLFALNVDGCGSGPGGSYQFDGGDLSAGDALQSSLDVDLSIWLAVAAAGLALGLIFFLVSIIAAGGLIAGTDRAYHAVPERGLRSAWRAGVGRFWAFLGLVLLVGAAGFFLVVLLVLAAGIPVGFMLVGGWDPSLAAIAALIAGGLLIGAALLVLGVAAQIVLSWSYRSLVLETTGVIASLKTGWRLFRENLGTSLLVWAVSFGLNLALGLVVGIPLLGLLIPLALALGFAGDAQSLVPVLVLGGVLALALLLVVKAFSSTFFAAYWTIAFRRLQAFEAQPPQPSPAPAAPPEPQAGTSAR